MFTRAAYYVAPAARRQGRHIAGARLLYRGVVGRKAWVLVLAVAGCNQIYGLDATQFVEVDAPPPPPDRDEDGAPDAFDNCPDLPNADQHDEDRDTVGDACDDCPHIADGRQDDFDQDRVGDACDPNPASAGDCLRIFDSFTDASAFAQRWTKLGAGSAVPMPDFVAMSGAVTFASTELSGRVFDVQVVGTADPQMQGSVGAGSNFRTGSDGHACEVQRATDVADVGARLESQGGTPTVDTRPMSSTPVGATLELRMTRGPAALQGASITCRAEYGVAVGVAQASVGGIAGSYQTAGSPGVRTTHPAARIEAIAIFEHDATGTGTCTTIRR
jgi:hypothetical protein